MKLKSSFTAISLAVIAMSTVHAQQLHNGSGIKDYKRTVLDSGQQDGRERPQWVSINNNEKWPGGQYRYYINLANIPPGINPNDMIAAMHTAAARWSGMCNININYLGTTTIAPNTKKTIAMPDEVNVWGFSPLTGDIAELAGYAPWTIMNDQAIIDADIILNSNTPDWNLVKIESIMTHEIGHSIGLSHSDVQSSIMSATPYHDWEYNRTLRGDDAAGCAALYGASPNQQLNRTLNWAESVYKTELQSGPSSTQIWDGYTYRYYGASRTYAGTKNGVAYFMAEGEPIQTLGPLNMYWEQVTGAGY